MFLYQKNNINGILKTIVLSLILLGLFTTIGDAKNSSFAKKLDEQERKISESLKEKKSDLTSLTSIISDLQEKSEEVFNQLIHSSNEEEQRHLARHYTFLISTYFQSSLKWRTVIFESPTNRVNPSEKRKVLIDSYNFGIRVFEKVNSNASFIEKKYRQKILSNLGFRLYQMISDLGKLGDSEVTLKCIQTAKIIYEDTVKKKPELSNESKILQLSLAEAFWGNDHKQFLEISREVFQQYKSYNWSLRYAYLFPEAFTNLDGFQKYDYYLSLAGGFENHPDIKSLGDVYWDLASSASRLGMTTEAERWLFMLLKKVPDHPMAELGKDILKSISKDNQLIIDNLNLTPSTTLPLKNQGKGQTSDNREINQMRQKKNPPLVGNPESTLAPPHSRTGFFGILSFFGLILIVIVFGFFVKVKGRRGE